MFRVHEWAEAQRLYHRERRPKAEIARGLDMSRTTLDRLLGLPNPPVYERRAQPSKLDSHKDSIRGMLETDPRVASTVVLEHLRRDGYDGGRTILKDYLQQIRPEFLAARAFQRTSYLPGEIAQADWWEPSLLDPTGASRALEVPVGKGRSRKVYGLVVTLPHSAAHACVFTLSKTMADFMEALVGCLTRLGGVPEKLVYDNDTSIIASGTGRNARLHPEVAALFGYLRLRGIALDGGKPESKGQVERNQGYFESSFLPLRTYTRIEDLQEQFDTWTNEVAFPRHHRRVGSRVADAWNVERGFLHRLPDPMPSTDLHLQVRVSKDCFIRVRDVDYSVPPNLVGRKISVSLSGKQVAAFLDGAELARHQRSYVPADVVLAPEHVRALRLAREARRQLQQGDVEVEVPDLRLYDALVGATP